MSERLTVAQESEIRWRLEGAWSLVWSEIDALRADLRHAVDCDGWRGGPNALHNEPCPKCAEIRKGLEGR